MSNYSRTPILNLCIFYVTIVHTYFMVVGDIRLPTRVQEAMQMQVEAERKKRASVLESEGKEHIFMPVMVHLSTKCMF